LQIVSEFFILESEIIAMKMNLYQFQLLSRLAQAAVICNRGVYLSTRESSEYTIDLYQVDNFYVEVFFSHTDNEVIINSFYSMYALASL
jgi:hypothetical protein